MAAWKGIGDPLRVLPALTKPPPDPEHAVSSGLQCARAVLCRSPGSVPGGSPRAMPPAAMAQVNQTADPAAGPPANTGLPANMTAQQKYLRDVFLFKKLKETDALVKQGHHVQARLMLEDLVSLDPNPYSKDVHWHAGPNRAISSATIRKRSKTMSWLIQYSDDKNVQIYAGTLLWPT